MKKTKKLALLIPILPLLMGTTALPEPEAESKPYDDILLTSAILEYKDPDYKYCLEVENKGNEHAMIVFKYDWSINVHFMDSHDFFANMLIAPGTKESYDFETSNNEEEIKDWIDGIEFYYYSIPDENVTFKNIGFKRNSNYPNQYLYTFTGKIGNTSDYYYELVFDVVYKGKDYSFAYNMHYDNIYCQEELDLDKFEIKSVKAYRSSYSKVREINWPRVVLVSLFVMFLIIFVIIPAIIFLIVFLSIKHRHKKIITL